MPHVIEETFMAAIDLRQQAGAELTWVTVNNGVTSAGVADVDINTTGVPQGFYPLVLDSIDSNGLIRYTDTITIAVT